MQGTRGTKMFTIIHQQTLIFINKHEFFYFMRADGKHNFRIWANPEWQTKSPSKF